MNEQELYEKYNINPLETSSAVGLDFSKSFLLKYAANLEYKENEMLACHELCKFCHFLDSRLKEIVNNWEQYLKKCDEDKLFIIKNRIKYIFYTFRFFVHKRNQIKDLDPSRYEQRLKYYLDFINKNEIIDYNKGGLTE